MGVDEVGLEGRRRWSVCGLDCGGCDLRRLPTDNLAANRIISWFQEMGWLSEREGLAEVINRGVYCRGCRGERTVHWSADCWILRCCVDERRLDFCYQCDDFPCERLATRAAGNERYAAGLCQLHALREAESG
jgi:hypothetical protein